MALEARNTSAGSLQRTLELINDGDRFFALNLDDLNARLEHFQAQWARFNTKHTTVCNETNDEAVLNEHRLMYERTEQIYLEAAGKLNRQIRLLNEELQQEQERESDDEENENNNHEEIEDEFPPGQGDRIVQDLPVNPNQQNVQPIQEQIGQGQNDPKVIYLTCKSAQKIENTWGYFDGNLTHWQGFHDRFKIAVHDDKTISNAFKFIHLQDSLKGRAAAAFGEWSTSDDNYQEAWERLKQMYARKYQTSHELLSKFEHLPKLDKPSGFLLQKMSNVTHEVLRQLRALKYPVEHYDLIFVHALHNKLDDDTKKAWELHRKSETPPVSEMLEFIEWQAKALAFTHSSEKKEHKDNKKRPPSTFNKSEHQEKRAKSNFTKPTNSNKSAEQRACVLCKENHGLYRCEKFLKMNLQTRRKTVKDHELCHNCLRPSHYSKDCMASACNRCNVKHNSRLCPENPLNRSVNVVQTLTKSKFKKDNRPKKE